MPRQQLLVDSRLVVVLAVEVRGGGQGQQVSIADVVLGWQDQMVVVGVGFALLVGHAARSDVCLDADDRLDPRLLRGGAEGDDTYIDPWSVSASAGMRYSATRFVISPMRLSPSSSENSLWTWRCEKSFGAMVVTGGPWYRRGRLDTFRSGRSLPCPALLLNSQSVSANVA